jgi:hypothetical protein
MKFIAPALLAPVALLFASMASAASPAKTSKPSTDEDPGYAVRSSTKIDFSEANIEGRMKAPEGFFLQGRTSQDLQNLLKLRSNFRQELSGSAAAAEAPSK